ncbi:MAG: SUMF1/EgtB/PvdO family nonheme iron enzyme [Chthonomonadales bacterium]
MFAISFLAICTMAIVSIRSSLPTENHDEKPIVIPAGMALVPSGEFIYGSDDEDADDDVKPARRISLPGFLIDLHEVTNREYQKYDPNHAFLPGEEDLPATGVLYNEAEAYAKSAGKRLPTDEEWEKATRGTDGRRYPWGNTWDAGKVAARAKGDKSKLVLTKRANLCRVGPSRVSRTGTHPEGNSPYGCVDMAGNAWEWVQGYYQGNKDQRILRGGAVGYGERACRAYNRGIEGSGST